MSKKTAGRPVQKGATKVPLIMQLEALECGASSRFMFWRITADGSRRSRCVRTAA